MLFIIAICMIFFFGIWVLTCGHEMDPSTAQLAIASVAIISSEPIRMRVVVAVVVVMDWAIWVARTSCLLFLFRIN